jgi:uncharacterized membrane protein
LTDFWLAGHTHSLWIARGAVALMVSAFAMLALTGISFPVAALFAQALAPFFGALVALGCFLAVRPNAARR